MSNIEQTCLYPTSQADIIVDLKNTQNVVIVSFKFVENGPMRDTRVIPLRCSLFYRLIFFTREP